MSELLLSGPMPFKQLGKPRLVESNGHDVYRVEGVFQNYQVVNENGRRYGKSVWDTVFGESSDFMNRLNNRGVLGMIEHPEDGITRLDKVSHVVVEARYASPKEIAESKDLEDGDILGAYETLPTPDGRILESLLKAGVRFGVSSRGNGTVTETSDCIDVNDDFQLETWDAVFTPSVTRAIPTLRAESEAMRNRHINSILEDCGPKGDDPCEDDDEPEYAFMKKKDQKNESSFVLATGIMNCGEQLIPIQLIAESSHFRWYNGTSLTPLSEVRSFPSLVEAFKGIKTFCESQGHTVDLPLQPEPDPVLGNVTESKNTMNKQALADLRKVKADVIRLSQTETKDLSPLDKVGFFESVTDHRIQIGQLTESHPYLRTEGESVLKILNEFEEVLDDEVADDGIPPEVADEAPEIEPDLGDDAGAEEGVMEVEAVLQDCLDCCEDPDLQGRIQDILNDLGAGDVGDDEFSADDAPVEGGDDFGMEDDEDVFRESRRRIGKRISESDRRARAWANRRVSNKLAHLESQHKNLKEAAAKLLRKYQEQRSSSLDSITPEGGEKAPLKDSPDQFCKGTGKGAATQQVGGEGPSAIGDGKSIGERAVRFEEAAKELAGRYNKDMREMGAAYIQQRRPDLWENHSAKFQGCKTWDAFTKLTERLVKRYPDPALGESTVSDGNAPLAESADGDKSSQKQGNGGLTEAYENPALKMVTRVRNKGSRFGGTK